MCIDNDFDIKVGSRCKRFASRTTFDRRSTECAMDESTAISNAPLNRSNKTSKQRGGLCGSIQNLDYSGSDFRSLLTPRWRSVDAALAQRWRSVDATLAMCF